MGTLEARVLKANENIGFVPNQHLANPTNFQTKTSDPGDSPHTFQAYAPGKKAPLSSTTTASSVVPVRGQGSLQQNQNVQEAGLHEKEATHSFNANDATAPPAPVLTRSEQFRKMSMMTETERRSYQDNLNAPFHQARGGIPRAGLREYCRSHPVPAPPTAAELIAQRTSSTTSSSSSRVSSPHACSSCSKISHATVLSSS